MRAKPIITAVLLAFVAVSLGYLALRESRAPAVAGPAAAPASAPASAPAPRFVAYYFHGTKRCRTCLKIQAQAEAAIAAALGAEVKAGRLAWRTVNVEESGNEHFTTEYKVTGSTLVIAEVKDGKPARFKKLDETWDLVHDQPKFTDYVSREVLAFLGSGK